MFYEETEGTKFSIPSENWRTSLFFRDIERGIWKKREESFLVAFSEYEKDYAAHIEEMARRLQMDMHW